MIFFRLGIQWSSGTTETAASDYVKVLKRQTARQVYHDARCVVMLMLSKAEHAAGFKGLSGPHCQVRGGI